MVDDIQYCGKCNRQQQSSEGMTHCKICKSRVITWDTNKVSAAEIKAMWKRLWGS
jgi:hypothetical protein